jgi:hypothetical protein
MKPFVIVDRATVEAEVELYGSDSSNLFLASQANAFMKTRLFEPWGWEVFFFRRLMNNGLSSGMEEDFDRTDEFLGTCRHWGTGVRHDKVAFFRLEVAPVGEHVIQSACPNPRGAEGIALGT